MQLKTLFLTTAFLLFSQAAQAELKCLPDNDTQTNMNICAANGFEKADKELNLKYKKLHKCLPDSNSAPSQKMLLQNSQRAWLKYRDTQTKFNAASVYGGSAYAMEYSTSMQSLTDARNKELDALIKQYCESGLFR